MVTCLVQDHGAHPPCVQHPGLEQGQQGARRAHQHVGALLQGGGASAGGTGRHACSCRAPVGAWLQGPVLASPANLASRAPPPAPHADGPTRTPSIGSGHSSKNQEWSQKARIRSGYISKNQEWIQQQESGVVQQQESGVDTAARIRSGYVSKNQEWIQQQESRVDTAARIRSAYSRPLPCTDAPCSDAVCCVILP